MPTIEIDRIALLKLQTKLRNEGIKAPDEIPSCEEWVEKMLDASDGATSASLLAEDYPHQFGLDRALHEILEACPICGNTECNRGVAWIGSSPIHADQHPEMRAERAMDNRGVYY